jgi:hypothetical protein
VAKEAIPLLRTAFEGDFHQHVDYLSLQLGQYLLEALTGQVNGTAAVSLEYRNNGVFGGLLQAAHKVAPITRDTAEQLVLEVAQVK